MVGEQAACCCGGFRHHDEQIGVRPLAAAVARPGEGVAVHPAQGPLQLVGARAVDLPREPESEILPGLLEEVGQFLRAGHAGPVDSSTVVAVQGVEDDSVPDRILIRSHGSGIPASTDSRAGARQRLALSWVCVARSSSRAQSHAALGCRIR